MGVLALTVNRVNELADLIPGEDSPVLNLLWREPGRPAAYLIR
jgi:hypothetical protein